MFQFPPQNPVSLEVTGSRRVHGLQCVIETPKYGIRKGHNWMNVSPADYGYIKGFRGADGDDIDCYIGPDNDSLMVYVVDQSRISSSEFDEHKVMLNYHSKEEAKSDYLAGHTEGHKIFQTITPLTAAEFKLWLHTGDLTKPIGK